MSDDDLSQDDMAHRQTLLFAEHLRELLAEQGGLTGRPLAIGKRVVARYGAEGLPPLDDPSAWHDLLQRSLKLTMNYGYRWSPSGARSTPFSTFSVWPSTGPRVVKSFTRRQRERRPVAA